MMNKLTPPADNAIFVTVEAAGRITSLGRNRVRKLADECGASRKIGKSYRINRVRLIQYIDSFENNK